jgi:hypothetical protein
MIPCLDHGSVELYSVAPNGKELKKIVDVMRRGRVGPQLLKLPTVYLKITAPIFVVNSMGAFKKLQDDYYKPETFFPIIDDINARDLETSQEIARSISETLEAGIVNRTSYVDDGCNPFIAGLTSSVCTYWSGIVYADLETWCQFFLEKHAPRHIKVYQKAVEDILRVEYVELDDYLRRSK